MRSTLVVLAWLCGCGRIAFDPLGAGSGGPTGDAGDANGDAADATVTTNSVCPTTVAFSDDFSATATSPIWTPITSAHMTYAQTGGLLELTFGSNDSAGEFTGYKTTGTTLYTEVCAIAELVTIPSTASNGAVTFQVGNAVWARFSITGGTMVSDRKGGKVDTRVWDAVAHRFLRMRGHAGTWYWDVSPDSITYTTVASIAFSIDGGLATNLTLEAGGSSAVVNGGRADFNSVLVLVP